MSNVQPDTSNFCHTVDGAADGSNIPRVYAFVCDARGRYLTISTVSNNDGDGAVLDFGEVKLHGKLSLTLYYTHVNPINKNADVIKYIEISFLNLKDIFEIHKEKLNEFFQS